MSKPNPILLPLSAQDIERFKKRIIETDPKKCWPWQGSKVRGYGSFWLQGRTTPAHRIAYFFATGQNPACSLVLHRCDNPPCCNPSHLFLGTPADNTRDMMLKGRKRIGTPTPVRGMDQHSAKLTDDLVRIILNLAAQGWGASKIWHTNQFPVSRRTIASIVKGRRWTHIR